MSVEIYHGCPDCDYMIKEYQENTLIRYIILDNEEMTYLIVIGFDIGFGLGCALEYMLLRKLKMIREAPKQ